MSRIELHPDRLLPAEPETRRIAGRLYHAARHLPIVSAHGHVEASLLAEDKPYSDPASLFVVADHVVTRLLHAHGVDLERLGLGPKKPPPREIWRTLCDHWWAFRGTPAREWLEAELVEVFGVSLRPAPETADRLYDELSDKLLQPELRPRALYRRFGVEVLATTDDPAGDLAAHIALAADPTFSGRVVPTFRPDRYLDPGEVGFAAGVAALAGAAGIDTGSYEGYIAALEQRRGFFAACGATSSDHGTPEAAAIPLPAAEASRIYRAALAGGAVPKETAAFRRHMLCEMARMSCDDGLVMQLHPGVLRNHHTATWRAAGSDGGHDIPLATEYTRSLRPLLERYGTHPRFRIVVFTLDESTLSRELAPLAGFYPSLYLGAPWWFLDTPGAMRRYRTAVTDSAGFYKTSGFVDDARVLCSIPARHDVARRCDAAYLARLVAEHRLPEEEALEVATELAYGLPRRVFRLA